MNYRWLKLGCAFVLGVMTLQAGDRDALWKAVEDAVAKGLPQTAITNLNLIIPAALKANAQGEAARALLRKILLEGVVQGNKPEEKIARLEAAIGQSPAEIRPLLSSVQAHWYWHYFQQNRWRFMNRTQTAAAPGKDFTTWDVPRLFEEISRQFNRSLAESAGLQKTSVGEFAGLLEPGTMRDRYRPTLYDFLAHEALGFYMTGEQGIGRPENAVAFEADRPVYGVVRLFGTEEEFLAGKVERRADESNEEKALFLLRDLMRFHVRDADPTARAHVDLVRLRWAWNVATGDTKADLYKKALGAFVDRWADHEIVAEALHTWAQVLMEEDNAVEARRLAVRGAEIFPVSAGGKQCRNLVNQIEAPSVEIATERIWNQPWPKLTVHYRNLTNLHFRAVAYDWDEFLKKNRSRPEQLNDRDRAELLAKAPALSWSAQVPATTDYRLRKEDLSAPKTLAPGFYFLLASPSADFAAGATLVVYADFWVSDLALVVRQRDGVTEGFVLEAGSGEPVDGAEVIAWHLDNQGSRAQHAPFRTDASGFFALLREERPRGVLLRARHQGREVATRHEHAAWNRRNPQEGRVRQSTIFFMDRALYRPGQTVQYKGICLEQQWSDDRYEVLANTDVTVQFLDANGKEVARNTHRVNDYGSFSGSFTAPKDRLAGHMQLRVESGPMGNAGFRVEEYKRPKFQVKISPPKAAPRLGEAVEVEGTAEAYTGAAVDGADVKWRVVREVRWPVWWGWWGWRSGWQGQESQEIAHGTARTGADGRFQVRFIARPDRTISPTNEPTFQFTVHADVTDASGETRSDERSVRVGYAAMEAFLTAETWQVAERPVKLDVKTLSLDGEPLTARGRIKIHRLKEPAVVQRGSLNPGSDGPRRFQMGSVESPANPADPNQWDLGEVFVERDFKTDAQGVVKLEVPLPLGLYRVVLESQDRFGKRVSARLPLRVLQPAGERLGLKLPQVFDAPSWQLEPNEEFMALWGTGYDTGRAFIEVEHRGKFLQRFWTQPGRTQHQLKLAVTEAMRGGFTIHVTQVRENRAYLDSRRVEIPWSNKELEVKWEHLVSKLQPGQKETWTVTLQKPKSKTDGAERAIAEMVATLYDASLDQFQRHSWPRAFGVFRQDASWINAQFENHPISLQWLHGRMDVDQTAVEISYRHFPQDLTANWWGYGFPSRMRGLSRGGISTLSGDLAMPAPMAAAAPAGALEADLSAATTRFASGIDRVEAMDGKGDAAKRKPGLAGVGSGVPPVNLGQVTARKNLNETAFFYPHLQAGTNGEVRMTFTMPEALTTWRFLGFAHDRELRSGYLEAEVVTAKDLMVQPNPPRFLREGDELEFAVKVSNQSTNRQTGKVQLSLRDAATDASADRDLKLEGVLSSGRTSGTELTFDIPAKESRAFSWRLKVPDGCGFLAYKAVGSTGKMSDGEEGWLPVLPRRILVTESLPLPIRGKPGGGDVTKKFELEKLVKSGRSSTLKHQGYTVQMVSQPAWYAVMALPFLMEFPHECSEQIFNRYYANALARHIAKSDPKIRRIFDLWKGTEALDSPLEKNAELKSVILEETPWVRQAQKESEARRNVGVLFDANRLENEQARTLQKLAEAQGADGLWPWFPGGRGNDYITLYIVTGFGRLRHLETDIQVGPAVKALARLDTWMEERYREILKQPKPTDHVPGSTECLYLYGRSFFLKDKAPAGGVKEAVAFFQARAREHWLQVGNRQNQGHLALALHRFGGVQNVAAAQAIARSLKERAVRSEEMGMFWRETELSWWWYRAPIETQAMMIEVFDEVAADREVVEECRVWLLKQKQTQDWKTTKATADAVYGLLLRGGNLLASDRLVEVKVGGMDVTPGKAKTPGTSQPEAGTGFYERRFGAGEVKGSMGEITVRKVDEGVSWGSVHWQYWEDMAKVTAYEGTPLKLKKSVYRRVNTGKGPVLEAVKGAWAVGDEMVVRVELRVDRDMEYVHLKDQCGSGTEPVNVLSGYRYQDGLGYYESTRDTASHFYIDYLPKGTYVFEYASRVQQRGRYQTGMASIQCMYAPEFNSHSESIELTVK